MLGHLIVYDNVRRHAHIVAVKVMLTKYVTSDRFQQATDPF